MRPLPSTRIWPSFAFWATVIVATGTLADGDVEAGEPEPPQDTEASRTTKRNDFGIGTNTDTPVSYCARPSPWTLSPVGRGNYSGVTYAAVRPPSTMNVAPFT